MIKIGNMHDGPCSGERVDWQSVLGNPFEIGRYGTREEVILLYRTWFAQQQRTTPSVQHELKRLLRLASRGDLTLLCWCAPEACHASVIKEWLEEAIAQDEEPWPIDASLWLDTPW